MQIASHPISLVIGLGNPGAEYAGTRHNAGFAVLSELRGSLPGSWDRESTCSSFVYHGRFKGRNLLLQEPQTYMNLSGEAVSKLVRKLSVSPDEVVVVHDDMDLPLGKLRLRHGGSAGGHHGIESIIALLGSGDFYRVRVGIGRHQGNGADYVLGTVPEEERDLWQRSVTEAANAVKCLLSAGPERAMNQYNHLDLREQPLSAADAGRSGDDGKNGRN